MISIANLRETLKGDLVAFDKHGMILDVEIPDGIGPAALLVSPVTDALKTVGPDGRLEVSVDRDLMWSVDAIVLSSVIIGRLDDRDLSAEDLLDMVRDAGFSWQISPTCAP